MWCGQVELLAMIRIEGCGFVVELEVIVSVSLPHHQDSKIKKERNNKNLIVQEKV